MNLSGTIGPSRLANERLKPLGHFSIVWGERGSRTLRRPGSHPSPLSRSSFTIVLAEAAGVEPARPIKDITGFKPDKRANCASLHMSWHNGLPFPNELQNYGVFLPDEFREFQCSSDRIPVFIRFLEPID